MRLFLYLGVALLTACQFADQPPGPVSNAIKEELHSKRASRIDIASLTKFDWDELLLFEPYQSRSDVCKSLGLANAQCDQTITFQSNDDAQMLMVFRKDGRVSHVEMHYRFNGDFLPSKEMQRISRDGSLFEAKTDGKSTDGSQRLTLAPIRAN